MDGNRKWAVFTFNLPSHNHIHIAKYLFSIRDGKYKTLGDNTVLAREMFFSVAVLVSKTRVLKLPNINNLAVWKNNWAITGLVIRLHSFHFNISQRASGESVYKPRWTYETDPLCLFSTIDWDFFLSALFYANLLILPICIATEI